MSLRSLVSDPGPSDGPVGLSRRRLLVLAALVPAGLAAVSACSASPTGSTGPDPLIALAQAAHADVALLTTAVAATPSLAARLDPVRAARTDHATALTAEITRQDPTAAPPPAPAPATPDTPEKPTMTAVRTALAQSALSAQALIATLPTDRVGLVASVAACCATYVAVLA